MTLKESHEARDEAKAKDNRPEKMKRKVYENELQKLQVRALQAAGLGEGRRACASSSCSKDATPPARAGRSRPSPKRSVRASFASPRSPLRPTARKSQMYMQRYMRAVSGRRRNRHLRPQLVQPRRRRVRDGVLHEEQHKRFLELCPPVRKIHRRRRYHTDQVLARGRTGRAGAAIQGPHRGSAAAVEAQPDGSRIVRALVRLLAGARHDA